ncbi:hypothetical protein Snoj_41290 [Streptomyces nojiriensis]|uniref:Uncharacterized protein n=1 Tax=Streptomyces nojiriensis TaxID=66374 RepID=A0ABQ3SPY7_9ACTN|nr:hypothetical protein JYK04_01508 [Streptomyces nojiriensis]GHI70211.1 hypothetical protein Snoj_41290 [Streptomyces nojiriensis]
MTSAGVCPARLHRRPLRSRFRRGGEFVYRLVTVGSWSAPDDPIALYDDTGPVPPPPLSELEKSWLGRRAERQAELAEVARPQPDDR